MSLTTFKPTIQFPIFTHQPPLHHHIHHRPTTTIPHFSRWNNANAQKHIQKQRSQQEIETSLRFNKRFQSANNITKFQPPQIAVPPPATVFKSAGAPSVPSQPSIPGKKSKYSKPINPNPRNPSFGNDDSFSGEPSWTSAEAPPLLSDRFSRNPEAQNRRKNDFERRNPRNPSYDNHGSFSGEPSWSSAASPPLVSGRFPKDPEAQNRRKYNFERPNPRNPSFGKDDSFSGQPSWNPAASPPLSSGRSPKNPEAQNAKNANFGKSGSFSGEKGARYPSLNTGSKSKHVSKFGNLNSQHPAFKRIVKMRQIETEIDATTETCVKVDEY